MPQVGNKKFAYTPKGEAKAASYAKKTGKKEVIKAPVKDSGMPSGKEPPKNPIMIPSAGHPDANTQAVPFGHMGGFQMPAEPSHIAQNVQPKAPVVHPLVPMTPGMIGAIRKAPAGKIPPGLAKWMHAHGKGVK